jgi:hypothetical protein
MTIPRTAILFTLSAQVASEGRFASETLAVRNAGAENMARSSPTAQIDDGGDGRRQVTRFLEERKKEKKKKKGKIAKKQKSKKRE